MKQVTYRCPKCKREYAEHVYRIQINAATGQVYRVPYRPQRCDACGTGLVRHISETPDTTTIKSTNS